MTSISEWVHQNSFLLLVVTVIVCTAVPVIRHRSRWLWSAWAGLIVAAAASLFLLHTPAAAVSEHPSDEPASSTNGGNGDSRPAFRELSLDSEDKIELVLTTGSKPTLVEIYVDFGLG